MKNDFETENLSNLIEVTARNIKQIYRFSGLLDFPFLNYVKNIFIKNTKNRSKENISKHYDLGNEFFSLWLDKTLTYSSAIFDEKTKDLSDAQNNKYQKLIDLIKPKIGDKVLEIGCGWGGFAEYTSLENIIKNSESLGGKVGENLRSTIDTLKLAHELVTIKKDVELPIGIEELKVNKEDEEGLRKIYEELEFRAWLQEGARPQTEKPKELNSKYEQRKRK